MGLFGKIKNILFEDDEEEEKEMPVYTKEDVAEAPRRIETEEKDVPVVEEPIKTSDSSHFRNVKRDIDLSFDEKDVLGEIPGAMEALPPNKSVEVPKVEETPKVEEKKSIFPSFDEDEFERLNSRINRNENKARVQQTRVNPAPVSNSINPARVANNNFSSTTTSDRNLNSSDRYKVNAGTLGSGKKPFTPSPVISPVYGILDKNYTKDSIVDKKGGMKREKIDKPLRTVGEQEDLLRAKEELTVEVLKAEAALEQKPVEVDIDSVRRKAYGELEELEKTLSDLEIPELKVQEVEVITEDFIDDNEIEEIKEEVVVEEVMVEDQLDEKFEVPDVLEEEKELDKVVEEVIETKAPEKKPQMLDELEKTSTLQILDDIEKELNSIKPMSKSNIDEDLDDEDLMTNSDTLENDLFNLIDSMYEEGEEEDND